MFTAFTTKKESVPAQDGITVTLDDHLILEYGDRRILGHFPFRMYKTPQELAEVFQNTFRIPTSAKLSFYTTEMAVCYGKKVAISDETWSEIYPKITLLGVEVMTGPLALTFVNKI